MGQSLSITTVGVFEAAKRRMQSQVQKCCVAVRIGQSSIPRPPVHVVQPGPSQCHALLTRCLQLRVDKAHCFAGRR